MPHQFVLDKKELNMETEIVALTTGTILLRLGLLACIGYAMYTVLRHRSLFGARASYARARN